MKLAPELKNLGRRLSRALHLDELRTAIGTNQADQSTPDPEWVIVYRTANGFCCMYDDAPVEFVEMIDVQVWSEEMDVQPYFMGL
ncbi:hypothetical protein BZM27_29695 [Paraburkholderia steynii]|uniref:Uncharacterized protein n=1 Tax=Paraburkholderia steynii TaxID=1245441 RepID=A0A4R0X6X7_9BURK|nr:hypothetical protein BZM27_29695 [Paraburkholderia steynii]